MRVALLSYRSKPHCGGQGVYVRHLSRELVRLGHQVEVFSGQPYPELDEGVRLTKVPSLDLYREPDPFRTPRPSEIRDLVDVQEVAIMWTAGFPEPRTFSKRVLRVLRERAADFDVVHDNQTLGYGAARRRGPDRAAAGRRPSTTRSARPADRPRGGADPAQAADAAPLVRLRPDAGPGGPRAAGGAGPLGVLPPRRGPRVRGRPERVRVVLLGVDDTFVPPTEPRVPGRILAMASADAPMKGIATLLEAFAKLRTERSDLELLLVDQARRRRPHRAAARRARAPRPRAVRARHLRRPSWSG